MIVSRSYGACRECEGLGDFGATSPEHGGECSVADFDGKPGGWELFCDCMWKKDRVTNAKCKSQPGLARLMAPWTGVGAGLRDIPGPAEWRFVATVLDPIGLFKPKIEEQKPVAKSAAQVAAEISAQRSAEGQQPAWLMPVAIGGGVVFIALAAGMLRKRRPAP